MFSFGKRLPCGENFCSSEHLLSFGGTFMVSTECLTSNVLEWWLPRRCFYDSIRGGMFGVPEWFWRPGCLGRNSHSNFIVVMWGFSSVNFCIGKNLRLGF